MIVTQFAAELRKKYRERMNDLTDTLAGGGAETFETYKHMTGQIHGLAYAESMLIEAAENLEKGALEK